MANVNMLKGSAMYLMTNKSAMAQPMRLGEENMGIATSFMPNQREVNQMRTANQIQNYANSKQMSEQGRTDMRGNVMGYSDTLG